MTELENLKEMLEWHCNETNNHHCRIVTELKEDAHGGLLRVYLKHDEKGNTVKSNGLDNVFRDIYQFERDNNAYVSTVDDNMDYIIIRE